MIEQLVKQHIANALQHLYAVEVATDKVVLEQTKPDFEGDFTFVVFPYVKQSKKGPEQTANEIGTYLTSLVSEITSFNVIKGFLNLVVCVL